MPIRRPKSIRNQNQEDRPQSWRERFATLRNIRPLLHLVWETNRSLCFATLGLRFIIAFIPICNLWVTRLILNLVVGAIHRHEIDRSHLWKLVAIDVALTITSDGLTRLINLLDSLLGEQFTNRMNIRIMEHAATLDLASFEDPAFYDIMERARNQSGKRLGIIVSLAGMARQAITLLTMMSVVLFVSPWLLPLMMIATIPLFLGETRFAYLNYSLLSRRTAAKRELDYIRYLGSSSQGAKEVKIFGLGRYLTDRAIQRFKGFYAENRHLAVRRALHGFGLNLISTVAYYISYVAVLLQAITGKITVGDFTILIRAFMRASDIMENLVSQMIEVSEDAIQVKDLFDYFETKAKIVSPPSARRVPRPIRIGYEFEGVSFAYPGSATSVFDKINLRIDRGMRLALVGENGTGKTTLVKLLARLYDPTEGRILLDGVDLREYDVEDLRREIGVIFQDYMRYDMTVAENIGFGQIEKIDDRARIEVAGEQSLAARIISKLPQKYDQMLGRRFRGGVDLSIGQWQKIALSRAYMRNAQVIILDEPTASLDARSEYEVYQRFVDLTRDKTAVLISHRFSTVRMADRILVLENGRIIEEGSHDELIAQRGKYSELFEMQAAGYR